LLRPGFVLAATLALCHLTAAQTPSNWRYDLRPGDRLVYSYTIHRQTRSDDAESETEARFHTQVVIAGEREGILSAGFQRNRESTDLLVYRVKGKDKLAQQRPDFEQRMQRRPTQFSEAMELTASGEPQYSWEIAREGYSHLLPVLHEIEILPPGPVHAGQRWPGMNLLGIEFELVGSEALHGKNCYHVRGSTADGSVTLSYWWSPESGVLERVELDGHYGVPGGTTHEQARMDLESRSRSESLAGWLAKPETRLAALQALLLSQDLAVTADQLSAVAEHGDADAQLLALAVAQRRSLPLSTAALNKLKDNVNPAVKLIAAEMVGAAVPKSSPETCGSSAVPRKSPPKFGTLFRVAKPEESGTGVAYFLRVPATYRADHPAPLLVYLSGGAGLALDGVNTANDDISNTDYLVLYPQAGAYWWTPEAATRVDTALRDTMTEFNVDRDRVYLAGFSNGGTGALYLAALWPQRFAAVVSLMGAGQCNEEVQKGLPNLLNLPLLFVHGEKDALIASSCSKATSDSLAGMHPRVAPQLHLLPGREHEITLQSDGGLTLAFLNDKVRDSFPKRVSLRLADLTYPRQYWVEVLEKKSGAAEVNAEIKQPNRLEIRSREVRKLRLHLRPEMFSQPGPVQIVWNGKRVYEGPVVDACTGPAQSNVADPKLDLSDPKEFSLP
jgi:pimeloyl-ACP methyl ester carboxylesterase